MKQWSSWHAQTQDLPGSAPRDVLNDFVEAIASFNVNAFKGSVAMSRRALQQALEDKGASKGIALADQVSELERRNLLDKAAANLAHGVRYFGNFGAHPQDDLLSQISSDEAKLALDVVEKILKELYK